MRWFTQRSPTVDGDQLYLSTVSGELVCLRTDTGQNVWQRSYTKDFGARRPIWGFTDHPLVDGERVIASPFATNATIAALNKHNGEALWQTAYDGSFAGAGYAALVVSTAAGVRQFVQFHGRDLVGYEAKDGRELWRFARPDTRIGSTYTPIPHGDLILSPNGYRGGLSVFKIERNDSSFVATEIAHPQFKLDAFQDATTVVNGLVYFLDNGVPQCVDAATGTAVWGAPTNQAPRAALTWAEGHLYIRNASGEMNLAEVSREGISARGSFKIPEHESSLGVTTPVVALGRLWLRDDNRLFCYDLRAGTGALDRPPASHVAIGLTDRELGVGPNAARPPRVGVNRAPDAVYVPTPQDIVETMLDAAHLKKTDVLMDLGSGDGRYIIRAAKKFGCEAIGYEIDPRLVQQSREAIERAGLDARARIEHQDIFTLDLSRADVITVFLYPRLMERLLPQLEKLKPGSRILSHQFEIPGVKPDESWVVESKEDGDKHRIYLWTTPLKRE